jgi:alpha-methylacyl-CoA racemase
VLELESDPVCRARETRDAWPEIRRRFTKAFKARSRSAWEEIFAAADACVEPVLSIDEALTDSHMVDRGTYLESFGFVQPAPAPRFAHTPSVVRRPPPFPGEHSRSALLDWGVSQGTVASLIESGAVIEWSTDNGTERN